MDRAQQNDGLDRGPMNALAETVLEAAGRSERVEETGETVEDVVDRRDVPGQTGEDTFYQEEGIDRERGS